MSEAKKEGGRKKCQGCLMMVKKREWGVDFCAKCEKRAQRWHKQQLEKLKLLNKTPSEEEHQLMYLKPNVLKILRDFDSNLDSILGITSTNKLEVFEVLEKTPIKLDKDALTNLIDYIVTKNKVLTR
jgi:hypothetical protein